MLAYNSEISQYKYMPLPWISKSRYRSWRYCQYNFYLDELEHVAPKPIDQEMEHKGTIGTNMHLVFHEFFNQVKEQRLIDNFMRIGVEHNPKDSSLFYAFFALCQDIIPKEARGVVEYSKILSNFCEFQVQNWIYITENMVPTKKNYIKYWFPVRMEAFLRDPIREYYGTADAIYRNPNFANDKKPYIIMDYKTGHTPASVRKFQGMNPFSVSLPTSKLEELHFYAWLVAEGKYISKGTLWYLMDWEECEGFRRRIKKNHIVLPPKVKPPLVESGTWKVGRKGVKYWREEFPDVKSYKDVIVAMVFLGDDDVYVASKKTGARTMNNIHMYSDQLREHYAEHGMDESAYERKTNTYACDRCFQSATCSEREAREIMGL